MLPMARLHNIEDCVTQVITDRIPGDLIEPVCGAAARRSLCVPY